MAFAQRNSGSFNSNARDTQDESWKAQGFVNIGLLSVDGERSEKLGAIRLKESDPIHQLILNHFKGVSADATDEAGIAAYEAKVKSLANRLSFEFRPATPSEAKIADKRAAFAL